MEKDSGGRRDCRIFWAAGGLPLPTPDIWLLLPGRRRPRISRDRAEGRRAPGTDRRLGRPGHSPELGFRRGPARLEAGRWPVGGVSEEGGRWKGGNRIEEGGERERSRKRGNGGEEGN